MSDVNANPPAPAAPEPLHRQLGVTDGELDAIRGKLGRDPNHTELATASVMRRISGAPPSAAILSML